MLLPAILCPSGKTQEFFFQIPRSIFGRLRSGFLARLWTNDDHQGWIRSGQKQVKSALVIVKSDLAVEAKFTHEGEKEYIQAIEQLAEKYRVTLFFKGRYDLNQMVYNLLSNSYDTTVFCSVCLTQKRL